MQSAEPPASPSAQDIARIHELLRAGDFQAALSAAERILDESPGHRDALLCSAIARRFLGRVPDALKTLEELERGHPLFSRLYEERGNCHLALKHAPQAIEAYLKAVNINNALPNSWAMLEGLYRMTQRPEDAAMAASHVAILRRLPPEVVTATGRFMDRDLDIAEAMIREFLLKVPEDIEAMRLLARIGMARKVFGDAELLLAALLEKAPDYTVARAEYAETLIEMQKYPEAESELTRLVAENPDRRHFYDSLRAAALVGLGENERATDLYRALLQETPADPELHLALAHTLKTVGRSDEAIAAYRRAAELRPAFGDAYWSLANLKTYRFTDDEIARLRSLQDAVGIADNDRYHLHFALAKALEDRGEYADAFHHYERGNALKRRESHYEPAIVENNTRHQIAVFTAEFFASRRGWGVSNPDPIFIVGLPRSGSTLLEQILASHSQVEGTQELPNVQQIVTTLRGREPDVANPRYPRVLAELPADEFRKLGQRYIDSTRIFRHGKPNPVPFFIDKMPNNFRHLGLIRLMLPNARIIDARREPLACCFSNLKQLFAKGQEFTYGVEDIARYYRTYVELMRHWDAVLPGWILRVQHEEVVDDLEGSVHRILDFCGLEFEPQCVEFHKTARSVRTASSEQVRRPINRDGVEQWRNFEPWLAPLKEALGDAVSIRDA